VPGWQGLQLELRYCQAELDQTLTLLDVATERPVGG
jgi:hypothetical protein